MGRKLLIVGAGLTGSLTAAILQQASLPLAVTVWDKARGAGGRMSTHRDPDQPNLHLDVGAQYISRIDSGHEADQEYEILKRTLYDDLLSNGILIPFSGLIEGEREDPTSVLVAKYVSPKGLNSIVKHFLAQSRTEVLFQHQLLEANIETSQGVRRTSCKAADEQKIFDIVVFTQPVPQIFSLEGDIMKTISPEICSNLSSVSYTSRYALGLFYKEHVLTSWSARYFDDSIIRFAAWDTSKRNCSSHGSSLLLHTSVPFGIKHLEEDKEEVKALMMQRASELIQAPPHPIHSHVVRWRYSQVSQVYPGSPGCLVLSRDPLVVATGDGFSGSNFENCIKAAQVTARTVIEHVQ